MRTEGAVHDQGERKPCPALIDRHFSLPMARSSEDGGVCSRLLVMLDGEESHALL